MKIFELPYNFEDDYFDKLNKLNNKYFDFIKFVYLPAFKENNIMNSREYDKLLNDIKYKDYRIYSNILNKFKSLNIDICILIQKGATLELIDKYVNDFDIHYFVINDDELARQLKNKYKDKIYLILSITRVLTYNDLLNTDFSMYDEIVLAFWFNRHLKFIKELPKKYKYCILVNSTCNCYCKYSKEHWFGKPFKCKSKIYKDIVILPKDLIIFKNYVNSFKIVDRTSDSNYIMNSLRKYIDAYISNIEYNKEREQYYDFID